MSLYRKIRQLAGLPEEETSSEILEKATSDLEEMFRNIKREDDHQKYLNSKDFLLDRGCTCHTGNPPCSWCVDTTECSICKERVLVDDCQDREGDLICWDCWMVMLVPSDYKLK